MRTRRSLLKYPLIGVFMGLVALCLFFVRHVGTERGGEGGIESAGGILRFDFHIRFGSINPLSPFAERSGSNMIYPLLYSYLFVLDENYELEPDLAVSWSYDPGTYTWSIVLRKDAFFHDGTPVTGKDVIYSLENFLKSFPTLPPIAGMSLEGDTVLKITLTQDDPHYVEKLSLFEIVPHGSHEPGHSDGLPIGSGPFKFLYRVEDREVGLEANQNYFLGRPALDGVTFHFVADRGKSWERLLDGRTDLVMEIDPMEFEMVGDRRELFRFHLSPMGSSQILLYNTHHPLFADPRVRKALSLAIDREHILREVLRGHEVPYNPTAISKGWAAPSELSPSPFDPGRALALLQEAGWSIQARGRYLAREGIPFEFTIALPEEEKSALEMGHYLQLYFDNIGIKAHLKQLPWVQVFGLYDENTAFEAVLSELLNGRKAMKPLSSWVPDADNRCFAGNFHDEEFSGLLWEIHREESVPARLALMEKACRRLNELQPGTFLFERVAMDVMSKRIDLPGFFSLSTNGVWHLKSARLNREWKPAGSVRDERR